jgi:hypothetical protein
MILKPLKTQVCILQFGNTEKVYVRPLRAKAEAGRDSGKNQVIRRASVHWQPIFFGWLERLKWSNSSRISVPPSSFYHIITYCYKPGNTSEKKRFSGGNPAKKGVLIQALRYTVTPRG